MLGKVQPIPKSSIDLIVARTSLRAIFQQWPLRMPRSRRKRDLSNVLKNAKADRRVRKRSPHGRKFDEPCFPPIIVLSDDEVDEDSTASSEIPHQAERAVDELSILLVYCFHAHFRLQRRLGFLCIIGSFLFDIQRTSSSWQGGGRL